MTNKLDENFSYLRTMSRYNWRHVSIFKNKPTNTIFQIVVDKYK